MLGARSGSCSFSGNWRSDVPSGLQERIRNGTKFAFGMPKIANLPVRYALHADSDAFPFPYFKHPRHPKDTLDAAIRTRGTSELGNGDRDLAS